MIDIKTIPLNSFPYFDIKEIGVLLFTYYPTTIIYSDNEGTPIIKEWVDCSEDNKIDRYFYYKTNKKLLKQFIDGEISHLDLINYSTDGFVIIQDISQTDELQTSIILLNDLPSNYKPTPIFKFDHSDGVETTKIIDYFNLTEVDFKNSALNEAKVISIKNNSETLYLKFKKGKGIGLGTINTEVLGRTLLNFNNLYKNIALDFLLGSNRGDIDTGAKKNEDIAALTETTLYGNIAASYGILLRPATLPQTSIYSDKTDTQIIASIAFNLFNKSVDVSTLKEEYLLHSGYTINSYKQFLETILKEKLDMDLNWFNPINNNEKEDSIDYHKANKIINDIQSLSTTSSTEFKVIGKFRAVNCDTRHYSFYSLDEQPYTGYFEKLLKDGLVTINFIDIYQVSINRRILNEADKKEDKIVDTILAYYQDKI